jgi:hypothetical protein
MKTAAIAHRQTSSAEPAKGSGARRPFFTVAKQPVQAKSEDMEVQARLRLGRPGDRYEVEADRVADNVVDGRNAGLPDNPGLASGVTPLTQRQEEEEAQTKGEEEETQAQEEEEAQAQEEEEAQAQSEEEGQAPEEEQPTQEEEPAQAQEEEEAQAQEEEEAQAKAQEEEEAQTRSDEEEAQAQEEEEAQARAAKPRPGKEEEEPVQARSSRGGGLCVSEEVSRQVRAARGRGNPLSGPVRAKMEAQFGADFSGVRIHTDSLAAQLSTALRAQAFTRGNDIFFNEGRFAPGSRSGEHLLAHELTHTVQQGAVKPDAADVVRLAPADDAETYEIRPEVAEAVRLARGEAGKVNAKLAGADGKRTGWERLREYFNTAFGGPVVHEQVIDKITMVEKTNADGSKTRMDALPSWCGIFTWWAMKKAGIPIPDWKLGAPALDALKPRPQGELPRKGDIAIDVRPNNHFAMVTGLESTKDAEGKPQKLTRIATINGNTAGEDNLGGQVQEKWHTLSHWDHFLDPVGKLNLPDAPMVEVGREPDADQPASPEPAQSAPEPPAAPEPRPELDNLDASVDAPAADAPSAYPEPDLSMPPPADPGPAELVAKVEKADLGGTSDEATTAFIDASPSSMAVTQPDFGPAVDGKMKGEQTDLAENPPVLEAKTSGAVDAPITGPDDLPIPGDTQIGDGVKGQDPGDIPGVAGAATNPFRGNAEREKALEKDDGGSFWDRFIKAMRRYTSGIYTKDGSVSTSAGERQTVDLSGEADAGRMETQSEEGTTKLKAQRDLQTAAFRDHPGQSNIQPRMIDEQRPVQLKTDPSAEIGKEDDDGVRKYALAPLPEDVRKVTDGKLAAKLTPNLAEGRKQATSAASTRDTEKQSKIEGARAEAQAINAQADTDQRQMVITNRGEVAKLQGQGIGTAYDHVNQFTKDAAKEQTAKRKEVKEHVKKTEGDAKTKLEEGEKEAEKKKKESEAEAAAKKRELEKEQENDSWWDKVKSAVKKAVKVITDAIDKVFTALREAVKTIITKAKNAAIDLVNKGRNWVVGKLNDFRVWAKDKVDKHIGTTFPGLAKTINGGIDVVTDTAIAGVNKVADTAIAGIEMVADGLAAALDKILEVYQVALKTAVRVVGAVLTGDFAEALRAVIEGACEVAGIDPKPIFDFIDRAGKAVDAILDDPVGFIKNLFGAVGDGLRNFWKNIKQHMIKGVIGWLTGAMSEVNLTGPFEFTPKGILKIVLEILGLTYANIKAKIIKREPKAQKVFDMIEKGAEIAGKAIKIVKRLFTEGPAALWDIIKTAIKDLKKTVMTAIRNFIITTVIKEAFFWLLALTNPASILVKALKLLFDLIMFLIERIEQIKDFIMSVYDAVAAIAAGNFKKVTTAVEDALVRSIPVIISLVASVFGLGNIAKQVKGVIETVTKPINRVIKKMVDKVVKFARKMLKKLKAGAKKVKEKGKAAVAKVIDWWKEKRKFKSKDGGSHKIYYEGRGENAELMVASKPMTIGGFLAKKLRNDDATDKEKDVARRATKAYKTVLSNQLTLERLRREKKALSKSLTEAQKKERSKEIDRQVSAYRQSLGALAGILKEVKFEEESDLLIRTDIHATSGGDKAVEALPLTHLAGNETGSPPGSADPPGWQHARKLEEKGEDRWVRGHLVNDNLHGPGKNFNLVPITGSMNTSMSAKLEEPAKKKLRQKRNVLYYHAEAQLWGGTGGAKDLGRKITVTWGTLEKIENKEPKNWEKNQIDRDWVELTTRPSDKVEKAMTNINTAGRVNLQQAIGRSVTQNFVERHVMKKRNPPHSHYKDVRDMFSRLNPKGNSPNEVKRREFVKRTVRAVMRKRLGFGSEGAGSSS